MSPAALPLQRAAVLFGPRDLRIEERPVWPPQPNCAQVAVKSTGLCGSDLHYYLEGRNGDFALQAPLVLGHEAAGVVTAVGPGSNLVPGQRVAIEAGIMCNDCNYCNSGRYNLCKGLRFCSSAKTFPHLDGTLQDRMNHPVHVLHPLPDSCSFDQAALAEPLSVLIHASRRTSLSSGQSVLVFGVGAIGILACALAKSLGATRVVAIDINEDRLAFAKSNGFASQTYCLPRVERAKTSEEQLRKTKDTIQAALAEFAQEDGFDVVFECTGAEPCIQMSIHAAVTGGKVMLVGMGSRNVMLPLSAAALREVDIQGSFRYANTYPEALSLLASGKLKNIEKLITHRIPLNDTARAFELLARGKDEDGNMVIKIIVGDS
ncbi:GroES-like protein [Coniophora puteana RWD-64-598 SS2]|uniref:GroES-like protein n=1 Tax=Coniophora puteana (strain RWD-64-598) TaxID=741705 RepID=A0A5M3MGW3_CONPW|nr:GroES-like protein [Coniophora puteana RWD-64-598 SS2]EIW78462.1 GroES-like protein [Coniophora puteana RWD-64-598 SS2]